MDISKLMTADRCIAPICNCGLEQRVMNEYAQFHIRNLSHYYKGHQVKHFNNLASRAISDEPVSIDKEKERAHKELTPLDIQPYLPFVIDRINPREIYRVGELTVPDNYMRTAQMSTLTQMYPVELIPEKKKERNWANEPDDSKKCYSTAPQDTKMYYNMMTRYKNEVFKSKIRTFR